MKIWIVIGCWHYEGAEVFSAHSSRELAESAKSKYEADWVKMCDSYHAKELIIDQELTVDSETA